MFHYIDRKSFNSSLVQSAAWGAKQTDNDNGADFTKGMLVELTYGSYFYECDYALFSGMVEAESAGRFFNLRVKQLKGTPHRTETVSATGALRDVLQQIAGGYEYAAAIAATDADEKVEADTPEIERNRIVSLRLDEEQYETVMAFIASEGSYLLRTIDSIQYV